MFCWQARLSLKRTWWPTRGVFCCRMHALQGNLNTRAARPREQLGTWELRPREVADKVRGASARHLPPGLNNRRLHSPFAIRVPPSNEHFHGNENIAVLGVTIAPQTHGGLHIAFVKLSSSGKSFLVAWRPRSSLIFALSCSAPRSNYILLSCCFADHVARLFGFIAGPALPSILRRARQAIQSRCRARQASCTTWRSVGAHLQREPTNNCKAQCNAINLLPKPPSGLWRNGSASDSRSEGWEFESLWPHSFRRRYVFCIELLRAVLNLNRIIKISAKGARRIMTENKTYAGMGALKNITMRESPRVGSWGCARPLAPHVRSKYASGAQAACPNKILWPRR